MSHENIVIKNCENDFNENKNYVVVEYEELTKEIDNQNKVFNTLKMNIVDKALKSCKTCCEKRELKNLRCILNRESNKLQYLVQKAITLQEEDPTRTWDHIPMATTFAEDSMPLQLPTLSESNFTCNGLNLSEKKVKNICNVPKNPQNIHILLKKLLYEICRNKNILNDEKSLNKLAKIFKKSEIKTSKMQKRKKFKNMSKPIGCDCRTKSQLINEKPYRESDHYQLQNKVLVPDSTVNYQQNKINLLHSALQSLYQKKVIVLKKSETKMVESKKNKSLQSLENKIRIMDNCVNKLKFEMNNLQNERNQLQTENENEHSLVYNELRAVQDQIKHKASCKKVQSGLEKGENKYLSAQQKEEEQKYVINKLELTNKKIEDQIKLEISRIKEKFQEKLKELIHFPKLLENEQLKLAAVCKEKENLEFKLRLICKEFKNIKTSMVNEKELSSDSNQYVTELQNQIETFRQQIVTLQAQKKILSEKLEENKKDLNLLRSESVKIICREKERVEKTQFGLLQRLDCLEKELVQCRATARISISDHEEVIKKMEIQLNAVAYNFKNVQNQIKTLKNYITYLTKGSRECK